MNIWTRLGISVALTAVFYISAAEFLQPTLLYSRHKWSVCISFLLGGAAIFFLGRWINQRMIAAYLKGQTALPECDSDGGLRPGEPFFLLNLAFWGAMIGIFGFITVFIVPTYSKHQKPTTAHSPESPSPRPSASASTPLTSTNPEPPLQIPRLQLQGVVLRDSNSSVLINGRTYFVGDMIQGARLTEIGTNTAILYWKGTRLVLPAPK